MADKTILEGDVEDTSASELPADIQNWSKEHVRKWILESSIVEEEYANILVQQKIDGKCLLICSVTDFKVVGIPLGPAKWIIEKRDELVDLKASLKEKPGGHCRPYPFNRYHEGHRYRENSNLEVTETGPLDLIEPCHEFKGFINTAPKDQIEKFIYEVIPFGAACMNSRTNGTIHFGIGDRPDFNHGEILGFQPHDKEAFVTKLPAAIENCFEHKHVDAAKKCIKTPRFVEVLNSDMTFSKKYVLEVDIKPDYSICKEGIYRVKKGKNKKKDVFLYTRENNSTRDLLAETNKESYKKYLDSISQLSIMRKQAEDKRLHALKTSVQGSRLCEMLTGGTRSLDKSHFQQYILVANKSHPDQLASLNFLCNMPLAAILDFDPESAERGLRTVFEDQDTNIHSPKQYKIKDSVLDMASKLKLTRKTSWIFCNGCTKDDAASEIDAPSEIDNWLTEKGAAVRDVVSFLCRGDVFPPKKFLVIFILLSDVTDNKDPMFRTFITFLEELKGFEQILCICENEQLFHNWRQLIQKSCGIDISMRCIHELSVAEIKGTALSLWSNNRCSHRFLPGVGGSKVELTKKEEGRLGTLDILCVNQCEGGNHDKTSIEENFYRGGKVTWWNFNFCEEPGSVPFIKRDKFDYILRTIIPNISSSGDTCALFNIVHLPGCGGTTLAMHILWEQKENYRCAVLKEMTEDHSEVASQVIDLLSLGTAKQSSSLPVLLMTDNFDDKDDVQDLKQSIEDEYQKRDLASNGLQVIILNCIRTELLEKTESTEDTVFIGNKLSENEQRLFEQMLSKIEKTHKNADTFYGFMIMKENFSPDYIKGVAENTLKNFNLEHKEAELFAILTLMDFYSKNASLSVALCEEFLGLPTVPNLDSCKVEDGFGKFSPLLTRCWVRGKVVFEAVRVIHSSMAKHCFQELNSSVQFKVTKGDITNRLLDICMKHECIQGVDKLKQTAKSMLLKRKHSERSEDSQFSPLISAIAEETPGLEETVLENAAKCFENDAFILQLLARYYYLKKKNFRQGEKWAKLAKQIAPNNSYIADTCAQVIKHKLWKSIKMDKDCSIKHENLREYLKMTNSATTAFQEAQTAAENEASIGLQNVKDKTIYNTGGCLGELQVAVQVLDVLERTPIFSTDKKKLCDFLSNHVNLHDATEQNHNPYYQVLQEFDVFLPNLRNNMKRLFDFFDRYFVNLCKRFSQQDVREERTRNEVNRCFNRYANFFCPPHGEGNENVLMAQKIHQSLELDKADTHNALLHHLLNNTEGNKIEAIISNYESMIDQRDCKTTDKANFIYANIILHCVKPTSTRKWPYINLLKLLKKILQGQIRSNETSAVYFLAIMMLWPEKTSKTTKQVSEDYERYLSQLKSAFSNEMTPVNVGMWPVAHFFLGKKQGYDRFVCQKDVNMCSTLIRQAGSIRKDEKVRQLLLPVKGKVCRSYILADTGNPNVKVQVNTFTKSQLIGKEGSIVKFYVGFTMNGPIAFGIQSV